MAANNNGNETSFHASSRPFFLSSILSSKRSTTQKTKGFIRRLTSILSSRPIDSMGKDGPPSTSDDAHGPSPICGSSSKEGITPRDEAVSEQDGFRSAK